MIDIKDGQLDQISGGFLQAVIAAITIFTLPKILNDHRKDYNKMGHELGEYMWEANHPYDPNNPQGVYK